MKDLFGIVSIANVNVTIYVMLENIWIIKIVERG